MHRAALALCILVLLGWGAGCGYHVSGKADLLPKDVKTIAIPAFGNATIRYSLGRRLPGAIGRELLTRTRYQVVADASQADAVLEGAVLSYNSYPTVFDSSTQRASAVQLSVSLRLKLVERSSGKVLFDRPRMEFRERYEVAADQVAFFDESDPAVERVSTDVARTVVSAMLESF